MKRSRLADVRFFRALENAASVQVACRRAGYSRAAVYRWRAEDAEFAQRWAMAVEIAADVLAAEADRRGRDGVLIDEVLARNTRGPRRYSDTLLLARLKAVKPELYREAKAVVPARRADGTAPHVFHNGAFTVIDYAQLAVDTRLPSETNGTRK